jgi:peptidoglycan hydrolase CwlO-like protein
MSEEEMQRKMEFIVNQQAQFATDVQKLQESQAELVKKHNHLTDAMTTVVGLVGKLAESHEQLAAEQKRMAAEWAEQRKELAAAHAETDERLNAFISVVERYISERRNGQNGQGQNSDETPPAS